MSRKSRRNSTRSHSLQTRRDLCSEDRDLWEHLERSYSWWKFSSQKILLDWVQHGDPKYYEAKKFRRRIIRVTAWAWSSYAAWSGVTNSESIERSTTKITRTIGRYWRLKNLLWSSLTEQLRQYLRSSSSSYFFEFKKAEPRSWNAAKYTREYEYSWKRFGLSTCSTRSWWIIQMIQNILATPSTIADDVEDSEKRRNREWWERRTIAINTFTLRFSKSEEKTSRRQISLMSATMSWVCGLVLKWHDNSECICKSSLTE